MGKAAPQAAGGRPTGQMTENELLACARAAMARAVRHPRGSLAWHVQWAVYDAYADELAVRAAPFLPGLVAESLRATRQLAERGVLVTRGGRYHAAGTGAVPS